MAQAPPPFAGQGEPAADVTPAPQYIPKEVVLQVPSQVALLYAPITLYLPAGHFTGIEETAPGAQ